MAVTTADEAAPVRRDERARRPGSVVLPGLVNGHQHLTGDRLLRSTIPDDLGLDLALERWALPSHAAHTGDMDELSATLSLIEAVTNGITFTVEAGTVAHPARVSKHSKPSGSAARSVRGDGTSTEVCTPAPSTRCSTASGRRSSGGRARPRRRLGHARRPRPHERRTGRTGERSRPVARHPDHVPHVAEHRRRPFVPATDRAAPAGASRRARRARRSRARRTRRAHRRRRGRRRARPRRRGRLVPVGLPPPRPAGHRLVPPPSPDPSRRSGRARLRQRERRRRDRHPPAARLFAGLTKDTIGEPSAFSARRALRLATIDGARALGLDHEIGSLEVGKRADVVIVDTTGPAWTPHADDPTTALVWASDGRAVRDVVASGRVVVRDGVCETVDHRSLAAEAHQMHRTLVSKCGAHPRDQ